MAETDFKTIFARIAARHVENKAALIALQHVFFAGLHSALGGVHPVSLVGI